MVHCRATPTSSTCRKTASRSGTNGPTGNGDLGPVYGKQWRRWETPDGRVIDQITQLVHSLRRTTRIRAAISSRPGTRATWTTWPLPPCHCLFQFYVANGKLSCQLYQRSADIFLGVPFNIASMRCSDDAGAGLRLPAGRVRHTFGDAPSTPTISSRPPAAQPRTTPLPTMWINPEVKDIFAFKFEDFRLDGYDPHPHIPAPVAGVR